MRSFSKRTGHPLSGSFFGSLTFTFRFFFCLFEICDGVNIKGSASYDSYFQTRRAMNDNRVLMPVPTSVLEDNTNIEQNLGY